MANFSRWGGVAIDERKFERDRYVYTAVAVDSLEDFYARALHSRSNLSKKNPKGKEATEAPDFIDDIDYTWLELTTADKKRMPPNYFWGIVTRSLLSRTTLMDPLLVYIDGDMYPKTKRHTEEHLYKHTGFKPGAITLRYGTDYDKRVEAVNKAHKMAFWLGERIKGMEKLLREGETVEDPHKRILIESIIPKKTRKRSGSNRKPRKR
jgi:hypothetical protein